MILNSTLLAALLAAHPAAVDTSSASPTPQETATDAYSVGFAKQLRTSSSARERALSARMSTDPKAVGKALREAAHAAPTDALVQYLWSTIGAGDWSGCDAAAPCPEQALAWARVEPDNGLAWLPPLETLSRSSDEKAIDEAIARIARAERYDDHFIDAWLAMRTAVAARPMPAPVARHIADSLGVQGGDPRQDANGVVAMGFAAALPLPLTTLSHACRREAHPQAAPTRFEDCARIGRGIMHSDSSVLMKEFAASVVKSSGLQDDADREAKRVLEARQWAAVDVMNRPNGALGYFADLASTRSESRAQELLLARQGITIE